MLRLTKGSYADDIHRKKIQFADLSNQDETLDSLFGSASVTDSRCYGRNLFLMENQPKGEV